MERGRKLCKLCLFPNYLKAEVAITRQGRRVPIARSEIQMGTGNEFLNFNLIKK